MRRTFFTIIHSADAAGDPTPPPAEDDDNANDSRRILEIAPEMGHQDHEETDRNGDDTDPARAVG